ncbi:tail fiber assembly protein [Photorhabdus temperata]|nr:tail fiber assembly protein [Photorhabdus temperata]
MVHYSVMLNCVDTSQAPDVTWLEVPK